MPPARTIAALTGTRADFGLLRPVLDAIAARPELELRVVAAGAHLLPPDRTVDEVRAAFPVAAEIPMQVAGEVGRPADAAALGRGVSGVAALLAEDPPDWLLVLGDRIEAFAAAAAAAVAGVRVAHVHGGDRAEGVADEGMRHAITKLAHLHLAATPRSAERILYLGEPADRIRVVGSPAIDDLEAIVPLDDGTYVALGEPTLLLLLHPTGGPDVVERAQAELLLDRCLAQGRTLALDPNHDPGRDGILQALDARAGDRRLERRSHLARHEFVGLLKRVQALVGNSSAGRIEASAIPLRAVDVGPRQAGRECPPSVIPVPHWDEGAIATAIERAMHEPIPPFRHPYGPGRTGRLVADLLAELDPAAVPLAKRNAY